MLNINEYQWCLSRLVPVSPFISVRRCQSFSYRSPKLEPHLFATRVEIAIAHCSGAHFIGARLCDQGHQVRLIPAQFVKPFLKSNKNDFIDADHAF